MSKSDGEHALGWRTGSGETRSAHKLEGELQADPDARASEGKRESNERESTFRRRGRSGLAGVPAGRGVAR